jgi:hypothetical protein
MKVLGLEKIYDPPETQPSEFATLEGRRDIAKE